MGDEQQRGAVAGLQGGDQFEDLLLHRHIECGRRFIGDDELRFGGKGRGDENALAHAARKLMRITAHDTRAIADVNLFQQLQRPGFCPPSRPVQDIDQPISDLRSDPPRGIERGQRVLRDQGARCTNAAAAFGGFEIHQIGAVEQDLAAHVFDGLRQDAEHRLADHRFTGATFADEAVDLARRDIERDSAQQAAAAPDAQFQSADRQETHRSTGSKRSFKPSPSWLKERTVRNSVNSGNTSTHHA